MPLCYLSPGVVGWYCTWRFVYTEKPPFLYMHGKECVFPSVWVEMELITSITWVNVNLCSTLLTIGQYKVTHNKSLRRFVY
jgi:hypothetical protein